MHESVAVMCSQLHVTVYIVEFPNYCYMQWYIEAYIFVFLQDASDDDSLDQVQVENVEEPNSKLPKTSDREPVKNVSSTALRKSCQVCQIESTLDTVENKQEQNGSVSEMDTSQVITVTVDPFKAESKRSVSLNAEVEHVEERAESEQNNQNLSMRPVNDMLPSSDDASTLSEERDSTDNTVKSQASVTLHHDMDSSTTTQVASQHPSNPKEKSHLQGGIIMGAAPSNH